MLKLKILFLAIGIALFQSSNAVEWRNLDESHKLGGRMVSNGYMQGKVVLVCRNPELSARMESVWTSFKTKPFVLLGAYASKQAKASYPMYSDAGLANGEPEGTLYVVDGTGKVVYYGNDERKATEEVVTAITDMASPKNLAQWRRFLEFEFANLPGHAYVRLDAFRKKYPGEVSFYAKEIGELRNVPDIKKLGALISISNTLRDFAPKNYSEKARLPVRLSEAIRKYSPLRENADPRAAQEAKNAIADLQWKKASL